MSKFQPIGVRERTAAQMLELRVEVFRAWADAWHGLRYNATAEMGALPDEVIGAVTGHKSSTMVRKYAGKGRQRRPARTARKAGT